MHAPQALVVDDFSPIADKLRLDALAASYIDYEPVPGEVYKRVCIKDVPGIRFRLEQAVGPFDLLGMGYRINHSNEPPNSSIHSDIGWGTHALVHYLCDGPGGTAFWRHKRTGLTRLEPNDPEALAAIIPDLSDLSAWEQIGLVELKFNRAAIYDGSLFHSRWPLEAFGDDNHSGRVIVVAFFTPHGEVHLDPQSNR